MMLENFLAEWVALYVQNVVPTHPLGCQVKPADAAK
jgi:hypothetical protein